MIGSAPTIRVATWNIRAAIGPGDPFPPAWWRHVSRDRLARIAGIIAELDLDLVALQEVALLTPNGDLHDQPTDLARLTGMHVRYAAVQAFALVEPEDGRAIGAATWGNAILSRHPLEAGFAIGLPVGEDDALVEPAGSPLPLAGISFADAPYGTREPRVVVGGRLAGAGRGVGIVNAHLTYAGTDQRRAQVEAMAAAAESTGAPVIVAGDFNAPIEATEMRALAGRFDDAFAAVGVPVGDPRRASCGSDGIDHILTRGLQATSCGVYRAAEDASDHLPVVATFEVAPSV